MGYKDRCEINELLGKTFVSIENKRETLTFICTDGSHYKMFHAQD